MATSLPVIDLVYRRGQFGFQDSQSTAIYFFWFSISLAFWSAQGLYSRAFYAAGDTLTPMIAATILTLGSIPIYGMLFRTFSVTGLAAASDFGIIVNTLALAVLLHRKKLVPAVDMRWIELGKAALVAVVSGCLSFRVGKLIPLTGSRKSDVLALLLITSTWAGGVAGGLWILRSTLLADLRRRKVTAYPHVAEQQAEEISGGVKP